MQRSERSVVSGRLDGKTAVVTGATKGIGQATVARFVAEGAHVVAVIRPRAEVRDDPANPGVVHIPADIADSGAMCRVVETIADDRRPDICVANAGAFLEYESFVEADPRHWRSILEINLLAVLALFQAAARRMVADGGGGRLLATSSLAGLRGECRSPVYGASKAGVHAVVQSLAAELGAHNITVNAVAPGQIDTEMNARNMRELGRRQGQSLDQVRSRWLARIPVGRLGLAEEVAGVFAFLASDEGAFVSGETIRVDGGELMG